MGRALDATKQDTDSTSLGQQKWQGFVPHPTFEILPTVHSLSCGQAWRKRVSPVVANDVTRIALQQNEKCTINLMNEGNQR